MRSVQEGGTTRFAAEDAIAARLMDAAEIVFTTLSSTGRRAFAHTRRFDLVLIDEAAQASEMATLQPLTLAAGRCAPASRAPSRPDRRVPVQSRCVHSASQVHRAVGSQRGQHVGDCVVVVAPGPVLLLCIHALLPQSSVDVAC